MRLFSKKKILGGILLIMLVGGNLYVHITGLQMSEVAMTYERDITTLKQSNLRLEEQLLTHSSVHDNSAVAQSAGYHAPKGAIRWIGVAVAAR